MGFTDADSAAGHTLTVMRAVQDQQQTKRMNLLKPVDMGQRAKIFHLPGWKISKCSSFNVLPL